MAVRAARVSPEGAAATAATAAASGPSSGPSGRWHTIILAEYLAVMLTLFATEILGKPGKGDAEQQDVTAATRTYSGIAVRMTAASALFFVLALMSSGERAGKAAAALGGLVTLGAVINATPVWAQAADVFKGSTAKRETGVGSGGGGGGGGSF